MDTNLNCDVFGSVSEMSKYPQLKLRKLNIEADKLTVNLTTLADKQMETGGKSAKWNDNDSVDIKKELVEDLINIKVESTEDCDMNNEPMEGFLKIKHEQIDHKMDIEDEPMEDSVNEVRDKTQQCKSTDALDELASNSLRYENCARTNADDILSSKVDCETKSEALSDTELMTEYEDDYDTELDINFTEDTELLEQSSPRNEYLTLASFQPQEISSMTVSELQQLEFSQLSLREKVQVKKRGRSTPNIQISQPGISNNKIYTRNFNSEWYQRKSWLCGCEVRNALFCFPCLVFGGDVTWTKDGFRTISKMKDRTEKHEKSKKHVDNVVSLSILGTINIKEKLSETYRLSINHHNVKVKKNREILSKIIDCIFFCGNFETPLRGHVNPGVFRGLINFASKLDPDLKNHLETNKVFKGVSKTIQNDILDCLLQIYHEEIRAEINKASFVAVMADDTTDVSEHTQMVIVLRYVLDGEIFERFWGFFIPENQTADGISECILEQLNIILQGNDQKLIAQTFDGANIMKGKKTRVQAKIKSVYSNAHFIHCYAHQLNLIMRNVASITRNARIFFSNILAIPTFFSGSPQRVSILKKHMDVSIPRPSTTRWNFNIRTLNRVHENFQPLKNCLTEILSTSNVDQSIAEATGILKYLNDDSFMFWLELFHQMIPHVEIIYNQMKSREISEYKVNEYITNFKTAILEIRNSKYCKNPSQTLESEAKEVCDCLCIDIIDRYSSTKHLVAAKLFNKKCFANFKKELPTEEILVTTDAYPMIDKEKLETELKIFYSRSDIREHCKLVELLKFIVENNLDDVLSEITKLVKILLTIPMTTTEPERCFLTSKRIKAFLRSTMSSERLNALAVLSIESKFLGSHSEVKEKIIDLFSQIKTRKMEFNFK